MPGESCPIEEIGQLFLVTPIGERQFYRVSDPSQPTGIGQM
jgi:hypothetical protein